MGVGQPREGLVWGLKRQVFSSENYEENWVEFRGTVNHAVPRRPLLSRMYICSVQNDTFFSFSSVISIPPQW